MKIDNKIIYCFFAVITGIGIYLYFFLPDYFTNYLIYVYPVSAILVVLFLLIWILIIDRQHVPKPNLPTDTEQLTLMFEDILANREYLENNYCKIYFNQTEKEIRVIDKKSNNILRIIQNDQADSISGSLIHAYIILFYTFNKKLKLKDIKHILDEFPYDFKLNFIVKDTIKNSDFQIKTEHNRFQTFIRNLFICNKKYYK